MEREKELSKSEKRWIVRELSSGRMTFGEAKERVRLISKNPDSLVRSWQKRLAPDIAFTLSVMTEKERLKLEAVQAQLQAMEKQLEDAQMKNIALETMIDIAEEQLNIRIRKKFGRDALYQVLGEHGYLLRYRRRKPYTTNSNHPYHKYPNLFEQAQTAVQNAVDKYNHIRPHQSCDNQTPVQAHDQNGYLTKRWKTKAANDSLTA